MPCPTPEQLAAVSLGLTDDARLIGHVETCDACAQLRAAQGDVVDRLAAIHGEPNAQHAAARAQLLERLPAAIDRRAPSPWRRWALGGIAAAAVLLLCVIAFAPSRLSAMERIANAVREVRSFSYKLTYRKESPETEKKPGRTLDCTSFASWRAPAGTELDQFGDFRATQENVAVYHSPTSHPKPVVLTDLIEIHPSGKPGILIDYVAKKYYRVPSLHADDILNSEPLLWLRAVRERSGRITGDLGSRQINGREARGYTMSFENSEPFRDFGPVEIWIDPQTDLPVEFGFHYAKAAEEGFTDKYSVTDIQWNIDLDPKLFDTTPPAGFLDVTIPTDDESILAIVNALRLYAELSGGRYPHVEKLDDRHFATKFDAAACYREMLELAGLTDSDPKKLAANPLYQRIEGSRAAFDILERILQSYKWLIGYDDTVRAQDKEKLLLWWNIARNSGGDEYRLFYGDLRTEVVPGKQWAKLAPPEIAELAQ